MGSGVSFNFLTTEKRRRGRDKGKRRMGNAREIERNRGV
ncbi:uncharacterized protein G2W53_024600 [Senna tora]|uniref:Uncharacterized protein n=1 Tax=Senna tora TaxID=362788 RepID=A0A834TDN5_9FABA|nr:uncharacterized protein G2W53_024600 [Senna tora]